MLDELSEGSLGSRRGVQGHRQPPLRSCHVRPKLLKLCAQPILSLQVLVNTGTTAVCYNPQRLTHRRYNANCERRAQEKLISQHDVDLAGLAIHPRWIDVVSVAGPRLENTRVASVAQKVARQRQRSARAYSSNKSGTWRILRPMIEPKIGISRPVVLKISAKRSGLIPRRFAHLTRDVNDARVILPEASTGAPKAERRSIRESSP